MKKIRLLGDTILSIIVLFFVASILMIMIIIIIPLGGADIYYQLKLIFHKEEMRSYPYDNYEYLKEIGNNIFKGDGIEHLNEKPEDVLIEIERQENGYICELTLKKDKYDKYVPKVSVTAQISEEFEILDFNYLSEEEYVQAIKGEIRSSVFPIYVGICAIETIVILLFWLKTER